LTGSNSAVRASIHSCFLSAPHCGQCLSCSYGTDTLDERSYHHCSGIHDNQELMCGSFSIAAGLSVYERMMIDVQDV